MTVSHTLTTSFDALSAQRDIIARTGSVFAAIFQTGDGLHITAEVEAELLAAARGGDQDAGEALMLAYAGAIASAAGGRGAKVTQEDAEAALMSAFWEHAMGTPEDRRIGHGLPLALRHAINDAWAEGLCADVPYRTARRYFGLIRRAGGDVELAASMAPDYDMSVDTFWAVYYLMRPLGSSEGTDLYGDAHAELYSVAESDYQLAHTALDAVEGVERDVATHAYGFASGEPMSDGEVAEAISERDLPRAAFEGGQRSISRPSVQRARARALDTMREALAAI